MKHRYCQICNNDQCDGCVKDNTALHFIPKSNVREMFVYHSHYPNGYNNSSVGIYAWNSTNSTAVPTRTFYIGNTAYCPYCGEKALPLQRRINSHDDYSVTGHTCICKGAQAEVEFKAAEQALREKHEQELAKLRTEYRADLTYDVKKLFDIEQQRRQKEFDFFNKDGHSFSSYFTTINGEVPKSIDRLFGID